MNTRDKTIFIAHDVFMAYYDKFDSNVVKRTCTYNFDIFFISLRTGTTQDKQAHTVLVLRVIRGIGLYGAQRRKHVRLIFLYKVVNGSMPEIPPEDNLG